MFYNSFFPSTIRAWNSFPEDIKQATYVASFEYRLNKDIKKLPKYYNAGTRIGQILQARMGMECSSLDSHLYRKIKSRLLLINMEVLKILITFSSNVQGMLLEETGSYPMTSTAIILTIFLFGIEGKTNRENEALFMKVQDFIVKSGRFAS